MASSGQQASATTPVEACQLWLSLNRFAGTHGPLSPAGEWTSSVYRNPDNGPDPFDQLEAVVLTGGGVVSYDRVNLAVQHAFRCVALPS